MQMRYTKEYTRSITPTSNIGEVGRRRWEIYSVNRLDLMEK